MNAEDVKTAEAEKRSAIEAYFKSFEERDLEACVSWFTDDAVIQFGPATLGLGGFRGREAIERWHRERFAGGARVVKLESIKVEDDEARVSGVFTSPRLKAVRIDDFRGIGTFVFEGTRFKEIRMGLKRGYRFHI